MDYNFKTLSYDDIRTIPREGLMEIHRQILLIRYRIRSMTIHNHQILANIFFSDTIEIILRKTTQSRTNGITPTSNLIMLAHAVKTASTPFPYYNEFPFKEMKQKKIELPTQERLI